MSMPIPRSGAWLIGRWSVAISQTDSFGRNMSTQLILCQYQNNSFMESLILAQDERWRRA